MNLIIDGSNLLHRAFWVAESRSPLVNTKGVWTGPVFIFLKSLKSNVDQFKPKSIWVTWDKRLKHPSTNFRKTLSPELYKQNRDTEKTAKVHEQHEIISEYLTSLGIKQMYPWVLEADDIISYLTKEKLKPSTIVSVDKDLLQLIDNNTQYFNPIKKSITTVQNFEENHNVEVQHFLNFKSLMGDKSDNVPGVEGYGVMRSKRLAAQGIDTILSVLSESDQEIFKHNVLMMDLHESYNKEEGEKESYNNQFEDQLKVRADIGKFESMCNEAEMYSFVRDLDKWKQSFSRGSRLEELLSVF
jgi:DNA polymerase-1